LLSNFKKHAGLYVYRREYLLEFARLSPTHLEQIEMLEQLRALENGAKIKAVEAASPSIGVDTQADLERVRAILAAPDIQIREAEVGDIENVADVHIRSWQSSFYGIAPQDYLDAMSLEQRTKRLTARLDRRPYTMLIAEHPLTGIVGFIDFGQPDLECGRDVQIFSFYLLSPFQRLGIGKRLFLGAMHRMREQGASSFCLDTLAVSPYRGFYDALGGQIIGNGWHKLGSEDFETLVYGWDDVSTWATGQA
jgi:ribosomal protein S18 acetylase RimI-like enzyme